MKKTDCFAYDSAKNRCDALCGLVCSRNQCPFYATEDEHRRAVIKSARRRRRLGMPLTPEETALLEAAER